MDNRNSFARTIVLLLVLQFTMLSVGITPALSLPLTADQLRETIILLGRARDHILQKFYKTSPPGVKQTSEQQDLHVFISYLDGRIYFYCEQLLETDGADSLVTAACPAHQNGNLMASRYMARPGTFSRTPEEQLAELDSSLNDSLGSFDEMLLREQQQISAITRKQREEGGPEGTTADEAAGGADPLKRSPERTSAADNQAAGAGRKEQVQRPPTIGIKDLSQSDDDIVAKQLKEAAEQETDPEIKTKLWEEYRKYKEGTR